MLPAGKVGVSIALVHLDSGFSLYLHSTLPSSLSFLYSTDKISIDQVLQHRYGFCEVLQEIREKLWSIILSGHLL